MIYLGTVVFRMNIYGLKICAFSAHQPRQVHQRLHVLHIGRGGFSCCNMFVAVILGNVPNFKGMWNFSTIENQMVQGISGFETTALHKTG